ncbi:MAG TPA: hypothetical protein EYG85_02105 [Crocinitomix sp.]|nr:hypothetical protein [Crocinitomix sp.]
MKSDRGMPEGRVYHFAIGVIPSVHSQLLTYAILTEINGKIVGSQILREQNFMYYIMGYWPTKANPKRVNLLEVNGIDSCFLVKNYSGKISGYYAKPISEMWKLRYSEHPYVYDIASGWSQEKYKPSIAQSTFLYENYGVANIKTNYFYGDSLFKILRDIQDPAWVNTYVSLSSP